MIHAIRLNVIDSWQRCPCGKLRVVLVGSPGESPADVHYCLACDVQPEAVWDRQLVHPQGPA
jgi:hypothetical protein